MSETAITDSGLVELLARRNGLLHLNVSGLHFGSSGVAAIGRLVSIWSLDLANCAMTDDQAATLLQLPRLRFVALDSNELTDLTLEKLANMPELAVVSLEGNRFSESALADFARRCPSVTILGAQEMNAFIRGKWD